jgi:hypothetical protein
MGSSMVAFAKPRHGKLLLGAVSLAVVSLARLSTEAVLTHKDAIAYSPMHGLIRH